MFHIHHIISHRFLLPIILVLISFCNMLAQSDPNANPNWDWRAGDNPNVVYPAAEYKVYMGSPVLPTFIKSPWSQFNAWDGLNDNQKTDGWALVARDFGTSTRAISTNNTVGVAYFMLYNKYRGLLRVFLLVQAQANFSNGAIIMNFGGDQRTATLTHLQPRAFATDKLNMVRNNSASALSLTVANGIWVWGDFPMAYDPTIVASASTLCPRLTFQVIGTTETHITLSGNATGINGTEKNVRDFMTGSSGGAVSVSTAMPTTIGDGIDFGALRTKVVGTSTNWESWKNSLNDLYKQLDVHTGTDPLSQASNSLALAIGELKNNWVVQNLPAIGMGVGLLDFILSGGSKTNAAMTAPTYFGMNLNLTGSAITTYFLATGASIPVPAATSTPEIPVFSSSVPMLYNNPVGIMNLTQTPGLKWKKYSLLRDGVNRTYWDFQVKNEIQYQVNPSSGLVLDSIIAWMEMDVTDNVGADATHRTTDSDLKQLANKTLANPPGLQLESTMGSTPNGGRYVFRSIPVNGSAFRFQTIQGPDGQWVGPNFFRIGYSPDMTIKIKAVLHRNDDPTTLPVLVVLTYEPDFDDNSSGTGNWPAPPAPVIAQMSTGWNFVSMPNQSFDYVSNIPKATTNFVYPNAASSAFTWDGNGYTVNDPLTNGKGYWIKFQSPQAIKHYGPALNSSIVNVTGGWNMIGSLSYPLPISKIKASAGVTVLSDYFGYQPGAGYYRETSNLMPGKAYWVKVSGSGTLILDLNATPAQFSAVSSEVPPAPPETPPPTAPTMSGVSVSVGGSYRPQLSWNSVGNTITYYLYRYTCPSGDPDCGVEYIPHSDLVYYGNGLSFTDMSIVVGNKFSAGVATYYVVAKDTYGQPSPHSNTWGFMTGSNLQQKANSGKTGDDHIDLPAEISLGANYPNPFNPATSIYYTLPEDQYVTLIVYNVLGQEVARLADGVESAGYKTVLFDASQLQSGVYYYRLTTGSFTQVKKMLLVK